MSNFVTAFNAKTHFSNLLARASQGEEIVITKRGKIAAKLVPATISGNRDIARAAAANLRKLAKEINSNSKDWAEWQNYKNFGRK